MKTVLASAAALAVFLLASPALAGDAACLWDHMPKAKTDAYVAQSDGENVTDVNDFIGDGPIMAAILICKVPDSGLGAAGSAFAGITRQHVAEARLAKAAGLTPQQLDTLWKTVDPEVARRLAEANHNHDFKTVMAILNELAPALTAGLPNPESLERDMQVYILGRATRAYFEPQF